MLVAPEQSKHKSKLLQICTRGSFFGTLYVHSFGFMKSFMKQNTQISKSPFAANSEPTPEQFFGTFEFITQPIAFQIECNLQKSVSSLCI